MRNVAVVFAGGTGTRMNTSGRPKQFIEVNGKPIIIHTLEVFQWHEEIDAIVVPCVTGWEDYLQDMADRFRITKLSKILPGGKDTQESKLNALEHLNGEYDGADLVVLHDAVRPLITADMITGNLETAREHGNAVSYRKFTETGIVSDDHKTTMETVARENLLVAAAPQTFRLEDALDAHRRGETMDPTITIDTCSLMVALDRPVHLVECRTTNIKITTPEDYYHFKAILSWREGREAFGL